MVQLLLAIIYISFISLGLPDSLLGSAWPVMYQELGVPISYAGIISMMITGCTIISSLFSNRLVRRLGTGLITMISVAMTAMALLGFSVSHSFFLLCLWAIPYGLGAGSVDAALNNFVALHYKARHMSWLHCFWGIGAALGPYIMGICLTRQWAAPALGGTWGWNRGYGTIAVIQVVLAMVLMLSLPLWKRNGQRETGQIDAPPLRVTQLLRLPGARPIMIAFFCYCSLEMTTGLWGSSYLVMGKGMLPEAAASFISLFYFGITVGRFFSGFLAARWDSKQLIRLGQGLAAVGILLFMMSSGRLGLSLGLVMIGLGCAPIYPGLLHQTPERFGKQVSGAIMGLQMACAYVGSTLSPPLVGFFVDKVNVTWYPYFLILFVMVMIFMVEYSNVNLVSAKAAEQGGFQC